MMLKRENFISLLNTLSSPISKAELHEDQPHIFSLTTIFHEDNQDCYKIICYPITEANFDMGNFVYSSIMHVVHDIYQAGLRADDKCIVATSGFRDACERIIERYQKELELNNLTIKLLNKW